MTPQEKESVRLQLADCISSVVDDGLHLADFETAPDRPEQFCIAWEVVTDGALVATVHTMDSRPVARFGVHIDLETLPDAPQHAGADGSCPDYGNALDPCPPGCASGTCVANKPAPVWMPATLRDCLAGDRMRIGQEETDVLFSNIQLWHADNTNKYQPRRWDHEELVLDLSANPGRRNYPPDMACEILCGPERAAALALQQSFPGTQPI